MLWWAFISKKYSGMNLTRRSSRASACRKWHAFVTEADTVTCTSLLMRPKEETVSLVDESLGSQGTTKEPNTPDSHKMNPYTLPTVCLLEFCCLVSCPWFIRVDGEVVIVGPITIFS